MPKLRISPEGVGEHLWIVPENKPAYLVDLEDLELSDELMDRFESWGDTFDAIFDPANPAGSLFPSAEAEAIWRAEGQLIAAAIRDELDDDWEVETKF